MPSNPSVTERPNEPGDGARVVVFARAPLPGQVKTRLAATIGPAAACEVYRRLGETVVRALASAPPRRYELCIAFTPEPEGSLVRAWLPWADAWIPQCAGDLGARLAFEVERAFSDGCDAVVLVGTDCLAVDSERVGAALDALEDRDAVLGPAQDGGYYLLALRRPLAVFEGVPWSTERVADVTRERLRDLGARWRELAIERDVDTAEDLDALAASGRLGPIP